MAKVHPIFTPILDLIQQIPATVTDNLRHCTVDVKTYDYAVAMLSDLFPRGVPHDEAMTLADRLQTVVEEFCQEIERER